MTYVPNTEQEQIEMLKRIGVDNFEALISDIPDTIKFKGTLDLPPKLSELEVLRYLNTLAAKNKDANFNSCFMGGGAYDHYVPAIVGMVIDRSEFKTAYTPYQAEVSQGTLQVMYEFQSMIAELTGMDAANASLYDGGSSLAEAAFLANAENKRTEFLIAGTIHPQYRNVIETICAGRNLTFKEFVEEDGTADIDSLKSAIGPQTSGVIVQHPNFLGNLEDVELIGDIARSQKALFIVVVDPISLGILKSPGEYDADVVVGEGQSLGIPMSFGGPYLGLFAAKQKFIRKLPGRICGITEDETGRRGFVLTLQTREQQIKREKATSNICTNQGLFMLASTVYMATMGKDGIKKVAYQCMQKAHYLAEKINAIPGFKINNSKPFFREFLVKTPVAPKLIIDEGLKRNILPGIDLARYPKINQGLLIAVTEKRTMDEMDNLIDLLNSFAK